MVRITNTAVLVRRGALSYYMYGYPASPCSCRSVSFVIDQTAQNTLVMLSDGTQLASIPFTDDGAGTRTNYPSVLSWSGDGWIQLFDTISGGLIQTKGTRATFTPPDDACLSLDALPSTSQYSIYVISAVPAGAPTSQVWQVAYSDGSLSAEQAGTLSGGLYTNYLDLSASWGPQTPYPMSATQPTIINGTSPSYTFTPASIGFPDIPDTALAADWAAAHAIAIVRERTNTKLCSDNMKANLKSGVLQDQLLSELRVAHPISGGTYQKALMTALVEDTSLGGGDDTTDTKIVTLSYNSTDSNGNPITLQQVITGTQRTVNTYCMDSLGDPDMAMYTTITFTNWLPVDASGSTGDTTDFRYQLDDATGLAQVRNGVQVTGAADIRDTFDSVGGLYDPPYPQSSDSSTYSYPQLYIDYRMATQRGYALDSGDPTWLDSAYQNGERVDVFPLSVIHSDFGDLGMFPQGADVGDVSKLTMRVDMKATYTYDYNTGAWSGSGEDISPITLPYTTDGAVIFRSRITSGWPDVTEDDPLTDATYKGQAVAIKETPGDYPLFVLLLSA